MQMEVRMWLSLSVASIYIESFFININIAESLQVKQLDLKVVTVEEKKAGNAMILLLCGWKRDDSWNVVSYLVRSCC